MHEQLRNAFAEIEQVLDAERIALRSLDVPGIELASIRKDQLEERIRSCAASEGLDDEDRRAASRVRKAALENQLLLVHARSCVRGALALATGQGAEPYSHCSTTSPGPLRVDLKG